MTTLSSTERGEHTPGLWSVTSAAGYSGHGVSAGRKRICSINSNAGGLPFAERDANARLIAAAPDMLEALRNASWLLADISPGGLVKKQVDEAIAKAVQS